MKYLQSFKWKNTREIVATVNPKNFVSGEAAYNYVTKNKLIPGLIRNIERGKKIKNKESGKWETLYEPLKVTRWQWFLEWHSNGYPHWHIFLEMENEGFRGQIGVERIRHYWKIKVGEIYESWIKDLEHFRHLTSYFKGHGYFELKGDHKKLKNHQMTLPDWAKNSYGAFKNIRRSGRKALTGQCDWVMSSERAGAYVWDAGLYFVRRGKEFIKIVDRPGWYLTSDRAGSSIFYSSLDLGCSPTKIDLRNGDVLSTRPIIRDTSQNYRAMIKGCGQKTKINLYSEDTTAIIIFDIPYKTVRKRVKGTYQDGIGYTFRLTQADYDWLFTFHHEIQEYDSSKYKQNYLKKKAERWDNHKHQYLKDRGVNAYYRKFG